MQQPRTQTAVIAPDLIVPIVADDTEEAPWMVMGDRQYWSATNFASVLHIYAQTHHLPWYVAGLLPIRYRRPGERRRRQVAPDVMVAFVPQRPRDSYDLEREGVFPAFVLEVLSQSSVARDVDAKRELYEALGAQEYVLFAPEAALLSPPLQGHRRAAHGRFEPLRPDAHGRLWSEVLGLWLVAEGGALRAVQPDGQVLLTHEESEAARAQEAAARAQEAAARQRAEEELARLRAMLERDRGED
jgi:Uma2 family endonuclease